MTEGPDPEELLGTAEVAVGRLLALGADCAEVYMASGSSVSVEVEKNMVKYTTAQTETGMGLRLVKDGRMGFAYTSDPDKVEGAGRRALELSRLAPRTGFQLPAGGGPYPEVAGLEDPALRSVDPGEAVSMARDLVEAARAVHEGVTVAGAGVEFGRTSAAIASSEELAVRSRATSMSASAYVVLKDATTSTGWEWMSSRHKEVDARDVGEAAARMALEAQGAKPLGEGGQMTIVYRPFALAELLSHTLVPSVIGDAAQRGESAYTGREGRDVASPSVTVVDDPLIPGGLSSDVSDAEGVPSRRNVLVEAGVLQGFLYDSYDANMYDVGTTASASRGGWRSQPEAAVSNLVLDVPSMGSLDDLVAEVDRGLIVHDVMGAHTANRSNLDFSINTTMPFEVRKGEVLGVRRPVMLGGNLGQVLEGVLGGGGRTRQCPPEGTNIVLPWLAADGVMVTP